MRRANRGPGRDAPQRQNCDFSMYQTATPAASAGSEVGPITRQPRSNVIYWGTMAEDLLARYRSSFPDIPGFFLDDAMFAWDFLLESQTRAGVHGDFFEIGVYKGRSAVLGALYLRPEDWCVLLDIGPVPEAAAMIESFHPRNNQYICCNSTTARGDARVGEHFRRCRWVHVDGDHKGMSVANDLALAADLLHENGIICVDDFFSFRYPQLTMATYKFLFDRQPDFQMFFAGSNKAYICRSSAFRQYDDTLRHHLPAALDRRGLDLQINRSSYAGDGGCFTIAFRFGDRKVLGLDEDPDEIVF